jgi:hypothetical protein
MDRKDFEEVVEPIVEALERIADALDRSPTWFNCANPGTLPGINSGNIGDVLELNETHPDKETT